MLAVGESEPLKRYWSRAATAVTRAMWWVTAHWRSVSGRRSGTTGVRTVSASVRCRECFNWYHAYLSVCPTCNPPEEPSTPWNPNEYDVWLIADHMRRLKAVLQKLNEQKDQG